MTTLKEIDNLLGILSEVKQRMIEGEPYNGIIAIDPVNPNVLRILPKKSKLVPPPVVKHTPKRPFTVAEALQVFATMPILYWKMTGKPLVYEKLVYNIAQNKWGLKLAGKKSGTLSPFTLMYHTEFANGGIVGAMPEAGCKGVGHLKFPITTDRIVQAVLSSQPKRWRELTVAEAQNIYRGAGVNQLTTWQGSAVFYRCFRFDAASWGIVIDGDRFINSVEAMEFKYGGHPLCVQQTLRAFTIAEAQEFYRSNQTFNGLFQQERIGGFNKRQSTGEWVLITKSGKEYRPEQLMHCRHDETGENLGVWVDKVS